MKKNLLILLGGSIGAGLRFAIKNEPSIRLKNDFPLNTLIINLIGCFLIGMILTVAFEYYEMDADVRLGIVTGFIGAFTTFSTMCKEIYVLMTTGHPIVGLVYCLFSLLAGFLMVILGVSITRILFKANKEKSEVVSFFDKGDEAL